MNTSRKQEIGVGILVIVAGALLAFMSIKVGALSNVGEEIDVEITLGDAAGLTEGAAVRVAGVQVGQVNTMGVDHDQARLSVSIAKSAQIRKDAELQVRARSILGEKYLEITPKSTDAPLIENGASLAVTTPQTEIDELVNSLGPLVSAIDAEAMHQAMEHLGEALEKDPHRIARLLENIDTIIGNGANASQSLDGLVSDTRSTLSSVRQVTNDTRPLLQRTQKIMGRVDTATENLPKIAGDVEAMVADARNMVKDSHALMQRLERSTEKIEIVLDNLSEIDKWELRRLLREEGILVRFKESEVDPAESKGK
jgi:phospholipid/cholesterol/gamma-HCH transport system substrate-binding protein